MANVVKYNARVTMKSDLETNWDKATSFIPLKGEIIHYSDLNKIKIGDGTTTVGALKFIAENEIDALDTDIQKAIKDLSDSTTSSISAINTRYNNTISPAITKANNAVLYTAQTLTDAQKEQARKNIGLFSSSASNTVVDIKVKEATKADTATNATNATNAKEADHAETADSASQAGHASYADEAVHATTADAAVLAAVAEGLAEARAISLSGDATGSVEFDGTGDVTINVTVVDDSHNHIMDNIDGLNSALAAKANNTISITAGNGLTGGGDLSTNRTLNVGAGNGITVSADAVAAKAGNGITVDSNGINHADTSSQASVTANGRKYITGVTLDTYGHVTGLTTGTETVTDTNTAHTHSAGTGLNIGTDNGGIDGKVEYSLKVATSNEIGGIKSGGDITVDSNGNVTVNNNSHTHTTENITSFEAAVKEIAAEEINTLIGGVSSADTINDITTLVNYVNDNGGEIDKLVGKMHDHEAGTGLTMTTETYGANGVVTYAHADTSTLSGPYGPSAGGTQSAKGTLDIVVPQITVDGMGHVTGVSNKTYKVIDTDTHPTLPTVNNGTLTIQKNKTTIATFTANQSGDVTANITVPTKTSELTNDSGYLTSYTETDPTVPAWAKASSKPSYNLGEVSDTTNYVRMTSSERTKLSSLATVATSGKYSDLTGKPTIPTGAAADKDVDTSISEGSTSTNLPTSSAVASYVDGKIAELKALIDSLALVYSGTTVPVSSLGENGDVYIQH